jgi:hypothetical protein
MDGAALADSHEDGPCLPGQELSVAPVRATNSRRKRSPGDCSAALPLRDAFTAIGLCGYDVDERELSFVPQSGGCSLLRLLPNPAQLGATPSVS